ncbi:MAG: hypothetical protein ABI140_07420, partial [Jatrophihabitantaceae bacterium]
MSQRSGLSQEQASTILRVPLRTAQRKINTGWDYQPPSNNVTTRTWRPEAQQTNEADLITRASQAITAARRQRGRQLAHRADPNQPP